VIGRFWFACRHKDKQKQHLGKNFARGFNIKRATQKIENKDT